MADTLTDFDAPPVRRNTFITVLCILTFIGSGWGLVKGIWDYVTVKERVVAISMAKENMKIKKSNSPGEQKIAENIMGRLTTLFTVDNLKKYAISDIATAIFCLIGAFLMWQLKKKGFYFYLLGTLIGIIAPMVLFGNNILAMGMSVIFGFIGLIFVVLYGVNLKHMN